MVPVVRRKVIRSAWGLCVATLFWGATVCADDPPAKTSPTSQASAGTRAKATPTPATPAPRVAKEPVAKQRASSGATTAGTTSSGATETIALEIVAKAPKPIPPVELDMLQLRLMLTDLKASFTDEIDEALFREPF